MIYHKWYTDLTIFLHLLNFSIVIQIGSALPKFGNELSCIWLWRPLLTLGGCVLLYFWTQEVTVGIYIRVKMKNEKFCLMKCFSYELFHFYKK